MSSRSRKEKLQREQLVRDLLQADKDNSELQARIAVLDRDIKNIESVLKLKIEDQKDRTATVAAELVREQMAHKHMKKQYEEELRISSLAVSHLRDLGLPDIDDPLFRLKIDALKWRIQNIIKPNLQGAQ